MFPTFLSVRAFDPLFKYFADLVDAIASEIFYYEATKHGTYPIEFDSLDLTQIILLEYMLEFEGGW